MWIDRVEGHCGFNRMTVIGKLNPMLHAKLWLGSEREWHSKTTSSSGERYRQGCMAKHIPCTNPKYGERPQSSELGLQRAAAQNLHKNVGGSARHNQSYAVRKRHFEGEGPGNNGAWLTGCSS